MDDQQLRVLTANNPSAMTGPGTNTYLLGRDTAVVIDPGPDLDAHLAAILEATGGRIAAILVTHAHRDHSGLAPRLAAATGAPVLAYGGARDGRRTVPELGDPGGGEGLDEGFAPDVRLADGTVIETEAGPVTALHLPGHAAGHMAFHWGEAVFSGDLVLGFASTFISPPDGNLGDFLSSCARLLEMGPRVLHPGHGPAIEDPDARLRWLMAHRADRGRQVEAALAAGPADLRALAARVYADLPAGMLPAAERNLLAHVLDLYARGRLAVDGSLSGGLLRLL